MAKTLKGKIGVGVAAGTATPKGAAAGSAGGGSSSGKPATASASAAAAKINQSLTGSSSGTSSASTAQTQQTDQTQKPATNNTSGTNPVYGTGTGNTSASSPHSAYNANDQANLDAENAAWQQRNQQLLGNYDSDRTMMVNQLQNNQPTMGSMMNWADAMTQARMKEDPLYQQQTKQDMDTIDQNAVKSGFYGQLPTEALKQQTAASDEAARNSAVFDLANNIKSAADTNTINVYNAQETNFKDTMDGIVSLLSQDSGEQDQEWQQNYNDNQLAFQKEQEAFQEAITIAGLTGNWYGQKTLQSQLDSATLAYNAAQTKLLQEQAQKQAIDNQSEAAANQADIANTKASTASTEANTAQTKKQTSLLGQNTGSSSSSGSSGSSSGSSSSGSKSSSGSGSSGSSSSSLSDLLDGSGSSSSSSNGSGSSSNSSSNSKSKNSSKKSSSTKSNDNISTTYYVPNTNQNASKDATLVKNIASELGSKNITPTKIKNWARQHGTTYSDAAAQSILAIGQEYGYWK